MHPVPARTPADGRAGLNHPAAPSAGLAGGTGRMVIGRQPRPPQERSLIQVKAR